MSSLQTLGAVALDSSMSADAALDVFAAHGLWLDEQYPAVRRRIEPMVLREGLAGELAEDAYLRIAARLQRNAESFGVAIRRQWGTKILWYTWDATEVLRRCTLAAPTDSLLSVLDLHEHQGVPLIELASDVALRPGVLAEGGVPVAVAFSRGEPAPLGSRSAASLPAASAQLPTPAMHGPAELGGGPSTVETWPRLDAPETVKAGDPFDVVVGFGAHKQDVLSGGKAVLPVAAGQKFVEIDIQLTATAVVQSLNGWSQKLSVPVDDPTSVHATFKLVGASPAIGAQVALTMLEVRYLAGATVCGAAARPLAVFPEGQAALANTPGWGTDWHAYAPVSDPIQVPADPNPPDLTIEIFKCDRNASSGQYEVRCNSPHSLTSPLGKFDMKVGLDAKTFARQCVDDVRTATSFLDNELKGTGRAVAACLPPEVMKVLREVAAKVAPHPPTVLIVSAEPYIPWELAYIEPALNTTRPPYLGAQVVLGRWLRDDGLAPVSRGASTRPPCLHPRVKGDVRHMAVMAGRYQVQAGLRQLPHAEAEANEIARNYCGVPLDATAQSMRQVLAGTVPGGIGKVDGMHLAVHGDFDPAKPEGSALFLADGTALRSTVFRSADYGGDCQPVLFLNACMLGIGGEVLGDMGGFPGNSLRGGFGAVLGALWEVDDQVAHDVALEFWKQALPAKGRGRPVGEILQDLRSRYRDDAPVSTYLAYVYYGHPSLTLGRASP